MIEINLLPEELRKKKSIQLSLPDLPIRKVLSLFFALFFLVQVILSVYAFSQKARIGLANQEIERLQHMVAEKLGYRLVGHRLELYCLPAKRGKVR